MKKIFLLLGISLATVSCVVDDEDRLHPNENSPYIVGFDKPTDAKSYLANGDVINLNVPIKLIGQANGMSLDSDITFDYELGSGNTGIVGNYFDFVSTVKTATIKAGETSTFIPLKIYTANIPTAANNFVIQIKLKNLRSGTVSVIGKQYEVANITINGLCFSNLAKTYDLSVLRVNNGVTYLLPNEVVTKLPNTDGDYLTSSTGPYNTRGLIGAGFQLASSTPGFKFTDVCDAISVPDQKLADVYSNDVKQSDSQQATSNVAAGTRVMKIYYSVFFTNNTVERAYIGTYTPQ